MRRRILAAPAMAALGVNGPEDDLLDWDAIDWPSRPADPGPENQQQPNRYPTQPTAGNIQASFFAILCYLRRAQMTLPLARMR
jgi:hypothetical protein